MAFQFNPISGQLDLVGSTVITSWKDPVADFASLPAVGNNAGDARVTLDTNQIYIWSGSVWVNVNAVVAVADTSTIDLTLSSGTITGDVKFADSTIDSNVSGIKIANDGITNLHINTSAAIDASKIANGSVSNAEFQFLDGVTSSIQTQLNSKVPNTRLINTTSPLTGGGDLSADRTISIPLATSLVDGYLSATDWNTFNNKQAAGNYITDLTGDVTATGPGSVSATIANNAVTDAKFRQSVGLSVVGRSTNTTGNVADITAGTDNFVLRRSGTALSFGLLVDANIDSAAAISRAKIAAGTADHVIINDGSGNLSSEAQLSNLRGGTGLNTSAATNGQLLIGNGTGFSLSTLSAGTGISIVNGAGSITVNNSTVVTGDLSETSASLIENQTGTNITGFAFNNAAVRSFKAIAAVNIQATANLYEEFEIRGIQRDADWIISVSSVGDDSQITFEISNLGQMVYSSPVSYAGFVSGEIKFRALVTSV